MSDEERGIEVHVLSWSPGAENEKLPCTEVHLALLKLENGIGSVTVLRMKTREGVERLIDALIEYADFVWPRPKQ